MSDQETTSEFEQKVSDCFLADGPLVGATSHFVSRPGQREMALAVARAIEEKSVLVAEAGTGTGKTFAYLTPALLSGSKVIVSTAGKPLQDQLYANDLPALHSALKTATSVAVLKGRSNYICLQRLSHARSDGLPSKECFDDLKKIERFVACDRVADKAHVLGVSEDSPIWSFVTSTRENCLGNKCPHAENCFVNKARARAKSSDVVIVNHHLFLSALEVRDGADADMLPKADLIILDEAHRLPEIAINFFGREFSSFGFKESVKTLRRLLMSRHRHALAKGEAWDQFCDPIVHDIQDYVLEIDTVCEVHDAQSRSFDEIENFGKTAQILERACEKYEALLTLVEPLKDDDPDLEKAYETAKEYLTEASLWLKALKNPKEKANRADETPTVRWISRTANEARLNDTPLSFAEDFKRVRLSQPDTSWVFTSATLATGKSDFSHFLSELGLEGATAKAWSSPFDYPNQAMLYIPEALPEPKYDARDRHLEALLESVWPVIDMMGGKTLFLCTSRQSLRRVAEALKDRIQRNRREYTVLAQGDDTRTALINRFRTHDGMILVATMSFWEGIDVKGDALSCVVIDKLPFAPKDDPVMKARCDYINEQGGNAFFDHQLPLAAISLKQGAGRLIRSENDRGVLIIGDTRLIPGRSRYAAKFLSTLPSFTNTRSLSRVMDFWLHPDSWS